MNEQRQSQGHFSSEKGDDSKVYLRSFLNELNGMMPRKKKRKSQDQVTRNRSRTRKNRKSRQKTGVEARGSLMLFMCLNSLISPSPPAIVQPSKTTALVTPSS
jgi:hypothetical protein